MNSVRERFSPMPFVPGIEHLAADLRAKHNYVYRHSERTAIYAYLIGKAVGLRGGQLVALQRGSILHDLGKIAVPPSILEKPTPLTPEEWSVIRRHPAEGYARLLGKTEEAALEIVRHHHERFDGGGYPDRLRGTAIPILARVVAIADSFDAMTSLRLPWRSALTSTMARDELRLCAGTQFDPVLVEIFCDFFDEIVQAMEAQAVTVAQSAAGLVATRATPATRRGRLPT